MATIKAYTDLEQSEKLAKILPPESADMYFSKYDTIHAATLYSSCDSKYFRIHEFIPGWSLAALLDVLQKTAYFIDEDANITLSSYKTVEWDLGINNSDLEFTTETNPVDAAFQMILKLHEQKLL